MSGGWRACRMHRRKVLRKQIVQTTLRVSPGRLLTFLLCFFPTLVASMTGFRALDERVLYLSRSMGATAWCQ